MVKIGLKDMGREEILASQKEYIKLMRSPKSGESNAQRCIFRRNWERCCASRWINRISLEMMGLPDKVTGYQVIRSGRKRRSGPSVSSIDWPGR